MAVRRLLHASGIRYRVDFRPLSNERFRVDIGWKSKKIAVFIDGCFWHGCPEHGTLPKSNAAWWAAKLNGNRERDARINQALTTAGWRVLRFWEHETADAVAVEVAEAVRDTNTSDSARRTPTTTRPTSIARTQRDAPKPPEDAAAHP